MTYFNTIPDLVLHIPLLGTFDVSTLLLAAGTFLGLFLGFRILQSIILHRLASLSARTHTDIDDVLIAAVQSIQPWAYTLFALYIALQFYTLPHIADMGAKFVVYFVVAWQAIEVATKVIEYAVARLLAKDEDGDGQVDPGAATASEMVTLIARLALWAMGGLFVLSNLGIEVTSLLAGLGIGGVAVAFALQGILSDLFASFSIYFDKPFRIGDYIVIGEHSGTVEKVGIKSTRIRTLQGEELVVSNAELTTARVQNFKKMKERRIAMQFGITYETPYDKVEAVNGIVERIFADISNARLDRVHFTTFADSALLFDVVYYVDSSDYTEFLNAQQQFNFDLMQSFSEQGIEFAYPTQTIYTKTVS